MSASPTSAAEPPRAATWRDRVAIARPDHWVKNVFVLPGAALAYGLAPGLPLAEALFRVAAGTVAVCLLASANYTINEWLDAEFDRHHPAKHGRPAASGRLSARAILLQWIALAATGLAIGAWIGHFFLAFAAALLVMGVVYNMRPLRTKDRPYLDVLSESINNPLRFMLGWAAVVDNVVPPSSILIAYWMGGAYLMAVKRYSEYRFIGDAARAARYRRSFRSYDEQSLLLSALFYALTSALCLGVFLIKYRIELILSIPFLALLFVWYLKIGMRPDSAAQRPEALYRERGFVLYVLAIGLLFTLLMLVDIPGLAPLAEYRVLR
ncbi:UbiA prenyltransferase family protein [Desertibaculum subflavum]|uniref:UbiA prenyltransferase family protein n=1 Tax=Desertibaculum subflavum TaxID=2268458 RepID=UPI000E66FD4C